MPRTGAIGSEDNASMKSARSNFQPPTSGPRSEKVESSAHPQIVPDGLKAQEEILIDQEGAAPPDSGGVLQGTNDWTEIGALRSELDEVLERTRRAETKSILLESQKT